MADVMKEKTLVYKAGENINEAHARLADVVLVIEAGETRTGPVRFRVLRDRRGVTRTLAGKEAQDLLQARVKG